MRAARRSEEARLSIKMLIALYMSLFIVTKMINIRFRNICFMRARDPPLFRLRLKGVQGCTGLVATVYTESVIAMFGVEKK